MWAVKEYIEDFFEHIEDRQKQISFVGIEIMRISKLNFYLNVWGV